MFACSTTRRLASIVIAFGLGLGGCAAESPAGPDADNGAVDDVSSALPVLASAASIAGKNFAGVVAPVATVGTVGTGTATGTGAIGGTTQVGGSSFGTGPIGTSFSTGPMGFSTGPIGTSTSFGTGPIGTSFSTGPIGFNTGGTTTMTTGTGAAPVISHTCTGFGCPP